MATMTNLDFPTCSPVELLEVQHEQGTMPCIMQVIHVIFFGWHFCIDSIDATSRREIVQDAEVFTYHGGHLKLIMKRTEMPRGSAVRQCSVQVTFADLWRVEPMLSLVEWHDTEGVLKGSQPKPNLSLKPWLDETFGWGLEDERRVDLQCLGQTFHSLVVSMSKQNRDRGKPSCIVSKNSGNTAGGQVKQENVVASWLGAWGGCLVIVSPLVKPRKLRFDHFVASYLWWSLRTGQGKILQDTQDLACLNIFDVQHKHVFQINPQSTIQGVVSLRAKPQERRLSLWKR